MARSHGFIARYQDSGAWSRLAAASRRQRENIFKNATKTEGDYPFAKLSKTAITAALDRRRATPFAALDFLKAMRGLFRWATEAGFIKDDPTEGVRWQVPRTEGFHVWTEDEIERFEARWLIGTRERLALAILLYTGLRRGDAARLGRQHVRDETFEIDGGKVKITVIRIRTEKTGALAIIPVLPELCGDRSHENRGSHIHRNGTRPADDKGRIWELACKAAVPGSAHGIRKAAATRGANNGLTEAQLDAIFTWFGGKMASLYTRQADRVKLAREAMGKLSK